MSNDTSQTIVKHLRALGITLSAARVRELWREFDAPHEAAAFHAWYLENINQDSSDPDLKELKIKNLKADLERKEIAKQLAQLELDEKLGKIESKAAVIDRVRTHVSRAVAMLSGIFISELPPRQGGLPSDQIAAMNEEAIDRYKKEMEKAI